MRSWKTWVGLVAIFLAGCVVGAAMVGVFGKHKIDQLLRGEKGVVESSVLKYLVRKLDLDQSTRDAIRPILQETGKELRELRRRQAPEIDVVVDRAVARIKERLDPERCEKLDALLAKFRAKRACLIGEGG